MSAPTLIERLRTEAFSRVTYPEDERLMLKAAAGLEKCQAFLIDHEWRRHDPAKAPWCDSCFRMEMDGHSDDCALVAALEATR